MTEWLINQTDCIEAEKFVRAKVKESGYSMESLKCHMKWSAGKHTVIGYCRYPKKPLNPEAMGAGPKSKKKRDERIFGFYTISARVKKDAALPVQLKYSTGTWQKKRDGCRYWGFIEDEETARSYDEVMVWIVAHELWHFLCKTKQEKGDYQTKANAFGFKWLREFKRRTTEEKI